MTFGIDLKMRLRLSALASLAFLVLYIQAYPATAYPRDLDTLLQGLRQESAVTVDFTEQRYLAYLTEPVIIKGQLTYNPDGRLERRVTKPKKEKMVIEGRLLIVEQNAKDPPVRILLADHPPLQAFVEALRALLAGNREALEAAFNSSIQNSAAKWQLSLKPKDATVAKTVEAIHVDGEDDKIESLEILETNGNRTLVELYPRA